MEQSACVLRATGVKLHRETEEGFLMQHVKDEWHGEWEDVGGTKTFASFIFTVKSIGYGHFLISTMCFIIRPVYFEIHLSFGTALRLQVLPPLAECAASTEVVPSTRTQAWVWPLPSLMSPDTSMWNKKCEKTK